jgi:hypothetical protein
MGVNVNAIACDLSGVTDPSGEALATSPAMDTTAIPEVEDVVDVAPGRAPRRPGSRGRQRGGCLHRTGEAPKRGAWSSAEASLGLLVGEFSGVERAGDLVAGEAVSVLVLVEFRLAEVHHDVRQIVVVLDVVGVCVASLARRRLRRST